MPAAKKEAGIPLPFFAVFRLFRSSAAAEVKDGEKTRAAVGSYDNAEACDAHLADLRIRFFNLITDELCIRNTICLQDPEFKACRIDKAEIV